MLETPLALTGADLIRISLNGLSRGMIIFLTASGLTLIFGLIGLLNFTHSALFTLGGYVTVSTIGYTGSFWAGLVAAVVVVGLVGLALERSLIFRLYDKEPLIHFLATFGIGPLILRQLLKATYGGQSYGVGNPLPGSIQVASVTYPTYRAFIIVVGIVVAVLVGALLTRTQFGLEVYATSVDTETASILGTNTKRIYTATFVLGITLAALAGGLVSPITTVYPSVGLEFMLVAFLVIIVGGMGSFHGSFWASILVGEIVAFGAVLVEPTYATMGVFLLAMVIILVRPRGFFGKADLLE